MNVDGTSVAAWFVAPALVLGLPAQPPAATPAQERDILGQPAAIATLGASTEMLPAETVLLAAPERAAAVLSILDVPVVVEVLERHDRWVRVRHGAVSGWVALPGLAGGLRAERVAAVDSQRREQRVAVARAVLGRGADRVIERAGVSWVTDVPSRSATFQRLLAIAACLPEVHGERYGLPEVAAEELPRPVVVLFARER
ncbi:MAG TPA: SH3 domain-containing protein, partial [Thermoanaerobaculia bacterium]|nr:SH3 domain-containing protein [Thermoanaerobaculia bacterium]